MRLKRFDELGGLRDALARARHERAEAEARARLEAARRARENAVFADAVADVFPLDIPPRADLGRPLPPPEPRQRQLDEQAALQEALSDDVDVESLLLTDDGLSFRRPGIGPEVLARLRRGHWAIQRQIDLHGLRRDEARETLAGFVRDAHRHGVRCLRVVHGKGRGSPGGVPVLKSKVQRWLAQRREVVAFAQAAAPQGGAGALIVLLAPTGRRGAGSPGA